MSLPERPTICHLTIGHPSKPEGGGGAPKNQLGHFREFTGAILHDFSTKIHDSYAICSDSIDRSVAPREDKTDGPRGTE